MSTPTVREQFLVISALGANPMELTNVLCRASHENRCAVVTSRLTRHGECSALVLQISGSWDALARLEAVVTRLESGELTLSESLRTFEEGISLSRQCAERLDQAEARIELLIRSADGEFATERFSLVGDRP